MLNKIKKGQESNVFMSDMFVLLGYEKKVMENKDNPDKPIEWYELLLGKGTNTGKFNAPADCGVETLDLYKEVLVSFSYDDSKGRLKIIGVFTPDYVKEVKNFRDNGAKAEKDSTPKTDK